MTGVASSRDPAARTGLDHLAQPIDRAAWCMGPATGSLEPGSLVTRDPNRWSDAGEPTIYLAGDPGVAISEFGRHWSDESDPAWMWALRLRLENAVDLRRPDVRDELGIQDGSTWILDRDRCRSIARQLRARGACDGLIVPSAAFLDDDARWHAVIFVEHLAHPLPRALQVVSPSHVMTAMEDPPAGIEAHTNDRD